jgi:hypothetical protein
MHIASGVGAKTCDEIIWIPVILCALWADFVIFFRNFRCAIKRDTVQTNVIKFNLKLLYRRRRFFLSTAYYFFRT